MMGIQASGKSSFCRKFIPDSYERVSLDDLNTRKKETQLLKECIASGLDVVIDNTNPTKDDRQRYIPILRESGYTIVGYFLQSKIKDCVRRNENRAGKNRVPSKAIAATSNRLELPDRSEGFDELYFVKISDGTFEIEKWEDEYEIR